MEALFYNALATAEESNYAKLEKLKEQFGTWESAWRAQHNTSIKPEKEWSKLEASGIELLLRDSPRFPRLLKETSCSPFGIYVRGTLKETSCVLAIVGTRNASPEGVHVAETFSKDLALRGATIVSGLALGIDAAAHRGALKARGYTIAVLGNGVDRIYPNTNAHLGEELLASGGALVSEYPPGSVAFPSHFLERNRIVSGLAHAVLVVEAPRYSGSLVTARFALEHNRDLFVIPGPVTHPNFNGSHDLIRKGAELVTSPEDIAESLNLPPAAAQNGAHAQSAEERAIIEVLAQRKRPADADAIAEACRLEIPRVNRIVSLLVLKRIVKETGGGYTLEN